MIESEDFYVKHTIQWVYDFVIKLNLCPFAKHEMDKGSAIIKASKAQTLEEAMIAFMAEVETLNTNAAIDTILLVLPKCLKNFFDYLDFVDIAEANLKAKGYEDVYQLATFHPDYCFAGVDANDVTNYTNRSPYPMLHLLREEQLEKAINYYGDTSKIPENNMACLRKLGIVEIHKMLTQIK